MEVDYEDKSLDRLETDASYTAGFPVAVVKAFRKKINFIRGAVDERDFYGMKSFHFEKLKGTRSGQFSIRLNDQWRLILKFKTDQRGKVVVVISIEDYHK